MLADQSRRFFETECQPHYEHWEKEGQIDRAVWLKAGALGLLGAEVPEAYGGPGGSFPHDVVITFEAIRNGVDGFAGPLHNAIVTPYIVHYGSEEQKQRWLPKLVSARSIAAIAMTEPAPAPTCRASRPPRSATATTMSSTAPRPSSPTARSPI